VFFESNKYLFPRYNPATVTEKKKIECLVVMSQTMVADTFNCDKRRLSRLGVHWSQTVRDETLIYLHTSSPSVCLFISN